MLLLCFNTIQNPQIRQYWFINQELLELGYTALCIYVCD